MKIKVDEHICSIEEQPINEKEINITECEFEFVDTITNDYVKEAYFTLDGNSYKQEIINNKCSIPNEVLEKQGQLEIGVVAYLIENEEYIKRYNPQSIYIDTWFGSLKENAENSQPITPSEMEQFEQALEDGLNEVANVNIDAEQLENGTSVTITNRNGEEKTVYVYNGIDGQDGEKGEKGDTGAKGDKGDKGDRGEKGEQGIQGIQGEQGPAGRDGTNGIDGENGQDGYTPIRGTDYWTSTDIATIESYCDDYIDAQLGPVNEILATLTTVGGGE